MRATISILGLYNLNDTLFDDLVIPENMDSDLLIENLVTELAELELIYSDFNFMKFMIGVWSSKELPTWERVVKASNKVYDTIENYDRIEEWHEDIIDDNTVKQTGTVDTDANNSDTTTVSAYDSSSFSNKDKVTSVIDSTDERDLTDKIDNDRDIDHEGRIHGNIGVTTSQQMLESELKLRYNNLYNMIADVFIKELLIAVY